MLIILCTFHLGHRLRCVRIIETIHGCLHVHRPARRRKNEPSGAIVTIISMTPFRRRVASNRMARVGWSEALWTAGMSLLGMWIVQGHFGIIERLLLCFCTFIKA